MNILQNIKTELQKALNSLVSVEKFKKYSSNEISISEVKVGGKVEIIQPDGTLVVAEDGEYELEDGTKFTVKSGLIDSIEGQEQELEEDKVEESKPDVSEIDTLKDEIAVLKEQIAAIVKSQEQFSAIATKEDVKSFEKEVKNLTETIQKLAKIPAEFSKTTTSNVAKEKNEDKVLDFVKAFNSK